MSKCYLSSHAVGFQTIHTAMCDCIDAVDDPCEFAVPVEGTNCAYWDQWYCRSPEAIAEVWADEHREAVKDERPINLATEVNRIMAGLAEV